MSEGVAIAAWTVLVVLLGAITLVDLRTFRIPNALTAALLLAGLVAAAATGEPGLASSTAGAVLGGLVLLAIATGFRRLRGRDGLGLGDVKFLAGAGAWVGWQGVGPVVFLAATTALLVWTARSLAGVRHDAHRPIAFGPYLCAALLGVRACQQLWPGLWS